MQWGYPRRWLAETESTNDVAREWAVEGAPEGAVVVASRQLRGRGRRARVWESPPDTGLYASFILRPGWLAKKAPDLAIVAGMAAFHALEKIGVPICASNGPMTFSPVEKKSAACWWSRSSGRGTSSSR